MIRKKKTIPKPITKDVLLRNLSPSNWKWACERAKELGYYKGEFIDALIDQERRRVRK